MNENTSEIKFTEHPILNRASTVAAARADKRNVKYILVYCWYVFRHSQSAGRWAREKVLKVDGWAIRRLERLITFTRRSAKFTRLCRLKVFYTITKYNTRINWMLAQIFTKAWDMTPDSDLTIVDDDVAGRLGKTLDVDDESSL